MFLRAEEHSIGMLKEAEAGVKTADLARRYGVSEATICNWKLKHGGPEMSEARRQGAASECSTSSTRGLETPRLLPICPACLAPQLFSSNRRLSNAGHAAAAAYE